MRWNFCWTLFNGKFSENINKISIQNVQFIYQWKYEIFIKGTCNIHLYSMKISLENAYEGQAQQKLLRAMPFSKNLLNEFLLCFKKIESSKVKVINFNLWSILLSGTFYMNETSVNLYKSHHFILLKIQRPHNL